MVIFVLDSPSEKMRGILSQWCIELKPGVFVGYMSKTVRNYTWGLICDDVSHDGALCVWATNTEQHFDFDMVGCPKRQVIEYDGLKLIEFKNITF